MNTAVIDASAVVAALVDRHEAGLWALDIIANHSLYAPALLHVEVASVLRRASLRGKLTPDVATLAYSDLLAMSVENLPYELCAQRIWELRENLTTYDAWYVALAELMKVPLVTLDIRLTNAIGPTCQFLSPPV